MRLARAVLGSMLVAAAPSMLSGCASDEIFVVDPGSRSWDYYFLAGVSGERVTRVAPLGSTKLPIEEDEPELLLVGLKREALAGIDRDFRPERSGELAIYLGDAPSPARVVGEAGRELLETPLPAGELGAELLIADRRGAVSALDPARAAMFLKQLVLVMPVGCEDLLGEPLVAFGARERLLPPSRPVPGDPDAEFARGLMFVRRLDRDHVLVASPHLIAVVARGGELELPATESGWDVTVPAHTLHFAFVPGTPFTASAVAVDVERPERPGRRRIVVAGSGIDPRYVPLIVDLEYDGLGLRFVSTASIGPGVPAETPYDVTIAAGGTTVVTGAKGMVLGRRPMSDVFELLRGPEGTASVVFSHIVEMEPDVYFLAIDDGQIFRGNPYSSWSQSYQAERFSFPHWFGLAVADGVPGDIWAAGASGSLFRRSARDAVWSKMPEEIGQNFSECALSDGPVPIIASKFIDVAATSAKAYVIAQECTAVLEVDSGSARFCKTVIPRGTDAVGAATPGNTAVDVWRDAQGGLLTVAGDHGAIYERAIE